jgi:glucose-6-phosphate isomerase
MVMLSAMMRRRMELGFRAQRLADAELAGALANGDEHDVAHSHDAAQQGEDADNPDRRT